MKTLGIFVTSDRFPDYALLLARAAIERGLRVWIHLSGSAVRLIGRAEFKTLAAADQVKICRRSAALFEMEERLEIQRPDLLVPPQQMGRMIAMCDRHLFL